MRKEAFTITWPRKNGVFNEQGKLESVFINPQRFYEGVRFHFKSTYGFFEREPTLS